jgi:hypothetical protein
MNVVSSWGMGDHRPARGVVGSDDGRRFVAIRFLACAKVAVQGFVHKRGLNSG